MLCYGSRFSPFVERVWLAAQLKGLDISFEMPADGIKSPAYLAMNPAGKMPVLVEEGFCLPESQVICDYLESKYPENPLYPEEPRVRAKAALVARLVDTTLFPALFPLFSQLDPKVRDAAVVEKQVPEFFKALSVIEHSISGGKRAVGDNWTAADCALLPALHFVALVGGALGVDFTEKSPKLQALIKAYGETELYAASKVAWEEGFIAFKAMKAAEAAAAAKAAE